ncbi:MAG: fused MFS/spermidine synthase [Proteobacteria bacterium]|nr:fused MFS/spermidine synthase [Pseudomonadota bacterium]
MLHWCVFICGGAVMIIELTGSRILAPILGTSLIVWTSLIGIVLASLSVGAWWGGIIADKHPEAKNLGRIVLLASWATAAIGLSKTWVLNLLQGVGDLQTIAITATVALFAPASVLLGMVAPFAVRLRLKDREHTGRTAGNLYAVSTIGSIVGTFLAGFVLIAWVGSTSILYITAAGLALASFLADPSGKRIKGCSLVIFVLAIFLNKYHDGILAKQGFIDTDTPYNRVLVYASEESATGRATREMVTGPQGRQSAMYLGDPTELAVAYTRFYRLAEYFKPEMKRMLVLGGGGFSFPKYALAHYPDLQIDVVELDPGIVDLARQHFALEDNSRLRILEEDARVFLENNQTSYDVILCDVFTSHYSIPFHLVTVEAIRRLRDALTPSGVVLVNVLASQKGQSSDFYAAYYQTLKTTFAEIRVFAVHNPVDVRMWQNLMLVGFSSPFSATVPVQAELQEMLANQISPPTKIIAPFTDEFAPVDRYTGLFGSL